MSGHKITVQRKSFWLKQLEALLRAFEEKLCMLGAARDTPTKENSHTLTEDFIHLWYERFPDTMSDQR